MLIVNIQKELGMMCGVDIIRKGMSHICLKLIVLILGGGMMRYELNFDEDKVNDVLVVGGASYDLKGCCDIMNEQQATINKQKKRINELEQRDYDNQSERYKILGRAIELSANYIEDNDLEYFDFCGLVTEFENELLEGLNE